MILMLIVTSAPLELILWVFFDFDVIFWIACGLFDFVFRYYWPDFWVLIQKIRTVEQDGKTIKLQIVSVALFAVWYIHFCCLCSKALRWMYTCRTSFVCNTHTHTHFGFDEAFSLVIYDILAYDLWYEISILVGYCWPGAISDYNEQLLPRGTWDYRECLCFCYLSAKLSFCYLNAKLSVRCMVFHSYLVTVIWGGKIVHNSRARHTNSRSLCQYARL